MSIKKNIGIQELKDKIKELFNLEKIETSDLTYLTNARSIAILKQGLKNIKDIKQGIKKNITLDMLEIDIRNLWSLLGTITGETYEEELVDKIFSRFCLGK